MNGFSKASKQLKKHFWSCFNFASQNKKMPLHYTERERLDILVPEVVLDFAEVEVLAGAPVVDAQHVQAGGLEVARGVVGLRDEELVGAPVVRGFVEGGDRHKPEGRRIFYLTGIRSLRVQVKVNS